MTERDYNYLTELRRLVSELSKIRGALEKIADRTKTNSQLSIELPDLETFFEEMEDDGK